MQEAKGLLKKRNSLQLLILPPFCLLMKNQAVFQKTKASWNQRSTFLRRMVGT